ncbi:DUF6973 domain-containing protein [Polaribacter sp. WD7]|uniref:DUF6973 domain-containing protein n=1 Tax=Polaribacter sp. WD7 TaxID=2269061 RepID=UPI0038D4B85D
MSFYRMLKNLNYKLLSHVIVWFVKHPIFMLATIKATFYTLKITQKKFPDIHDKNNKANAFRHALWNVLIAKQCAKFSTDYRVVLNWTKKITDWHEDFSVNEEMARLMDLHNNVFGRNKFLPWKEETVNSIVELLIKELSNAILVTKKSEIKKLVHKLIYLEK